ncbi:Tar ligand binding domain-containing protein, partial [Klebsiella pneumoniae]|uniref:Tar ligand binding domain-containing protein n=1 Tax=Klebsiella pneumoniae TaxID=573 RepID=UPI0015F331A9
MNTTPSQRLGFLHHIRLVPLFACILGGILVLFALSSALAGYFLWQADRDQRDVTAEIEIRTGLANSSDFLRSARINMIQAGAASRIAEMEAMKRNIAQAESEIKHQNRPVKTPADEALDTELNQRFQAYITGMQPMLKYAKNGMFEAIINHESEQIRPLDNAYTDILNKAVKIRSTRANQLAELAHQRTRLGGMFMIGAFVLALVM